MKRSYEVPIEVDEESDEEEEEEEEDDEVSEDDLNVFESLVENLSDAEDASNFCCGGSLPDPNPGLFIDGMGLIPMPITSPYPQNLMKRYKSGQLEPTQFSFKNPHWRSVVAKAISEVRQRMEIKPAFECQTYKLLIFKAGSKSSNYRDTKKARGVFATLIVELPSTYEGGELVITHDGRQQAFSFAPKTGEFGFRSHYFAFYSDLEAKIKPLTSGE
eukprot:TRINITY_DN4766_c0_g1_i1.p1 TRINITY_DN4766_c0_g1~~TRINITY_DN4766_c0_g1_i1.p1  ORF type:complete len:217 (+),score=22.11 TRINITY_DN4766_c0_g1_i1:79-729(+)